MSKIFLCYFIFIISNFLSAMKFNPINQDYFIERNYEILNNNYFFSAKNNSKIVDIINNFYKKYVKKDIHKERYMTRLLLFLVNISHEYHIIDEVLENIEKFDEKEIISYAKDLYLKFSKNNNKLIQQASIAFQEEILIEDLNKISLNNTYGIDVVYKNNNMINHHLINMIFYMVIQSNPNAEIISPSLNINLAAHIWFKLITIDQQVKMLVFQKKFVYKSYNPSVIIENLLNKKNVSNNEKISKIFTSLFTFTKVDFDIIKNAFNFINSVDDLKNFNKKDHFFLFEFINYKHKKNDRYMMISYFFEKFVKSNKINFENDIYLIPLLISKLNANEQINEIKISIKNEQKKSMYELLHKAYFYDDEVNNSIYEIESERFLLEDFITEKTENIIKEFKKAKTLNIDDILSICKKSLKEDIFYIKQILVNNLNNKQKNIYNKFNDIDLDYNEFKNVKIANYKYELTDVFKKIKSKLFTNEVIKIFIIKIIKYNMINENSAKQDVLNLLKEKANIIIDGNIENLLNENYVDLNSINIAKYKSKSKNLIGIDVFIFNEFLKELFLKIFYLSPESHYGIIAKSNKLNIELCFDEWALLFETLSKKSIFNNLIVQNIFNEIVNKFKDIESYLTYDNEHPFFDNYLISDNNKSLRQKLFIHYLYHANKEFIDNIKNDNNEEVIRNNFNEFLSKINYRNKILISDKEQKELKKQDKDIIESYLEELLGKNPKTNFVSSKKKDKTKKTKKILTKPKNEKKEKAVKKININQEVKKVKLNKKSKKAQKQNNIIDKGFIANKALQDNPFKIVENVVLIKEEPPIAPKIDLSECKYLLKKIKVPQLTDEFKHLQYKLNEKYENEKKIKEDNKAISLTENKSNIIKNSEENMPEQPLKVKTFNKSNIKKVKTEVKNNSLQKKILAQEKNRFEKIQVAAKDQNTANTTNKKSSISLQPKKIIKNAFSAAKKSIYGDFSYVANFLSPMQINKIQTQHKKFIDNFSNDKEKYTEMIKEISHNYCSNIFALDEFIGLLINQKYNEDIMLFNVKLTEVNLYIKNISSSNKNTNNLIEQIYNNFKYLNEHEESFIQLVYSSSQYNNLVNSFMQVDGNINEKDFSNLLLWGNAHIKQKALVSDRILAYKNKRKMYYDYIIFSYEELKKILNQ